MDHPLRSDNYNLLRKRVANFLKSGLSVRTNSNIIFVCGGKKSNHLRIKFQKFCDAKLDFQFGIFFPEFATDSYFAESHVVPFNISAFEEIVGELSHAIVIFPEAAGSYAETGYFSAKQNLAEKTVIVLNAKYQGDDSFISLGPQAEFDRVSAFKSAMHLDYGNPDFDAVIARLHRKKLTRTWKNLLVEDFSELTKHDYFCLIYFLFDVLFVATFDDVNYVLTSLSGNRHSKETAKQLVSIMVGAKYLTRMGRFGHYKTMRELGEFVEPKIGSKEELKTLRLEMLQVVQNSSKDFKKVAGFK